MAITLVGTEFVRSFDRLSRPDIPDLGYCKGCGICVEECPAGAIEMEPERI